MTREYINGDCLEGMKTFPDNHFDLAIVDPPYGIGFSKKRGDETRNKTKHNWIQYEGKKWDDCTPTKEYFAELFRVSNNQIIWGANHFGKMPPSACWVIWDKMQKFSTAEFEMAYTSFNTPCKSFKMARCTAYVNKTRIHPTQKPVALYRWLLDNYAKPGDLLLDTHVGSASSLIAFEEKGFEYVAYELDKDYYRDSCKRLETFRSQLRLFDPTPEKKEYKQLSITE